jgi:RimJ/RimL family protein N-acetyltransferase
MYNHKNGVLLRKVQKSDLKDLLALKKESWWGTHSTLVLNDDDQEKWYNSIPSNQLFLIGEVNSPIGVAVYTDIDFINRNLKISGSMYKEFRNELSYQGFCAGLDFAFEILNMHRIEAEVLEYHVAAQKLEVNLLGMKIEGRRRKAVYKCGKYYDSIILGLLRNEWEQQERVKSFCGSCNQNFDCERFEKILNRLKHSL